MGVSVPTVLYAWADRSGIPSPLPDQVWALMEAAMISNPQGPWACGCGHVYCEGSGIWVLALRPGKLFSTGGLCWAQPQA